MRILEESKTVLETNGYFVSPIRNEAFEFEDGALLGFVHSTSLRKILSTWSTRQRDFVTRNAGFLRKSSMKAWNLYSVFLTDDAVGPEERKAITNIEEDFHATRKIVQAGIASLNDVTRALYPFIPIQNLVSFHTDDVLETLRARLGTLPLAAVKALLDQRKTDERVAEEFKEGHANKID
jgi:hypothetical protein